MRYGEIISEAPLAMGEKWPEGAALVTDLSLLVYKQNWQKVGTLTARTVIYDIAICTTKPTSYIIGREEPSKPPSGKFAVIGILDLDDSPPNPYGYSNLASVDQVVVQDNLQGYQVGTQLYNFVVKSGITLLSDMSQYFGARRLWANISLQSNTIVDVVDTSTSTVVAQGVRLNQGKAPADFDKEYWSFDIADGKQNIRFVLLAIAPSQPSGLSVTT